ncbi:MAG: hypothetical protein EOM40_02845 [Clostridia bacterium]|nr:hypothetical protein [Clostridia bacterium]NCC42535.1 hypothetical protein [Clostridia bacterium]
MVKANLFGGVCEIGACTILLPVTGIANVLSGKGFSFNVDVDSTGYAAIVLFFEFFFCWIVVRVFGRQMRKIQKLQLKHARLLFVLLIFYTTVSTITTRISVESNYDYYSVIMESAAGVLMAVIIVILA